MSTSEPELAYNQTTSNPAPSLAERINALLLATDGPIYAPICFTRTNILKKLNLEPTLERKKWVTETFPELRELGWQVGELTDFAGEGEEILEFRRRH